MGCKDYEDCLLRHARLGQQKGATIRRIWLRLLFEARLLFGLKLLLAIIKMAIMLNTRDAKAGHTAAIN